MFAYFSAHHCPVSDAFRWPCKASQAIVIGAAIILGNVSYGNATSTETALVGAVTLKSVRRSLPPGVGGAFAALGITTQETLRALRGELWDKVIGDCEFRFSALIPAPALTSRNSLSKEAPAMQDFRYLIYYAWSELPPAEKPADVVLRSLKEIPIGTPVEEIKRAADAFGLDFTFMKAVAKIESDFDPQQQTGSYIGLFQLSKEEFSKFGSGQIRDPRDNAVVAAYKLITEGILFEWVTHRKPTLSDLYLVHQQGWEGAAQHISQPDRLAWKSMCATNEGAEKGENWCKLAIWGNTLPNVKRDWKSVDKLTSGAFVEMWRQRLAEFYSEFTRAATTEQDTDTLERSGRSAKEPRALRSPWGTLYDAGVSRLQLRDCSSP
jgi:Transglycosylase SLT domain